MQMWKSLQSCEALETEILQSTAETSPGCCTQIWKPVAWNDLSRAELPSGKGTDQATFWLHSPLCPATPHPRSTNPNQGKCQDELWGTGRWVGPGVFIENIGKFHRSLAVAPHLVTKPLLGILEARNAFLRSSACSDPLHLSPLFSELSKIQY